jgi:hypothetical protein
MLVAAVCVVCVLSLVNMALFTRSLHVHQHVCSVCEQCSSLLIMPLQPSEQVIQIVPLNILCKASGIS